MKTKMRGFTLIELLVVIAIIGLLASVILASLSSARTKGGDAAVRSNLRNLQTNAEMVASDNSGAYTAVCSNATTTSMLVAASQAGGVAAPVLNTNYMCNSTSAGWTAAANMKSTGYWCVDSGGTTKAEATLPASTVTACP